MEEEEGKEAMETRERQCEEVAKRQGEEKGERGRGAAVFRSKQEGGKRMGGKREGGPGRGDKQQRRGSGPTWTSPSPERVSTDLPPGAKRMVLQACPFATIQAATGRGASPLPAAMSKRRTLPSLQAAPRRRPSPLKSRLTTAGSSPEESGHWFAVPSKGSIARVDTCRHQKATSGKGEESEWQNGGSLPSEMSACSTE